MQSGAGRFEYRARVAAKLARLADLLKQWDDWDVDQLLPPAERSLAAPPIGGREALRVLHHALLTELQDLDARAVAQARRYASHEFSVVGGSEGSLRAIDWRSHDARQQRTGSGGTADDAGAAQGDARADQTGS